MSYSNISPEIKNVTTGSGWSNLPLRRIDMEKEDWIKRCEAQFDKMIGGERANWRDAAEMCYSEMLDDFQDDPEGAADEEMSYWDNDEA